jgi:hypothetical protein
MPKPNPAFPLACAAAILAVASQAVAETEATTRVGDNDYYRFKDDALLGAGFGAEGDVIRVRGVGLRVLLIRPRASFVPEMLKSVENL